MTASPFAKVLSLRQIWKLWSMALMEKVGGTGYFAIFSCRLHFCSGMPCKLFPPPLGSQVSTLPCYKISVSSGWFTAAGWSPGEGFAIAPAGRYFCLLSEIMGRQISHCPHRWSKRNWSNKLPQEKQKNKNRREKKKKPHTLSIADLNTTLSSTSLGDRK